MVHARKADVVRQSALHSQTMDALGGVKRSGTYVETVNGFAMSVQVEQSLKRPLATRRAARKRPVTVDAVVAAVTRR